MEQTTLSLSDKSKKPKKRIDYTEAVAIRILRENYSNEQGWAVIAQVPDNVGMSQRRTADALLVQLWPSRGIALYGIEYKRTKADFRAELAKPEKAESLAQYCDHWLILTPSGLLDPKELPRNWGLWEIDDKEKVKSIKHPESLEPKPLTKGVVAAILRAVGKYQPGEEAIKDAYSRGHEKGQAVNSDAVECAEKSLNSFREKMRIYQEASGLSLSFGDEHRLRELGEKTKSALALRSGSEKAIQDLENLFRTTGFIQERIQKELELLKSSSDEDVN